ncbi:MAG: helix-turn-helix domain-containing protein [Desulfobulbaceae bacterium]|nr:helix-turn-helix domain-containing protein [Candidatus Kapabacteria bacterium]MBS4000184.1 helix-turn-helix domain-containing protein [Desulfobulbaceae bacterium]
MRNIGKQISDARRKQNLSIKDLSERTKIRTHIIEAIEAENYSVMPEVYMNSFLKTLATTLKIDISTAEVVKESKSTPKHETPKTQTPEIKGKEFVAPTPKPHVSKDVADFAEIFKKKNIKRRDKKIIYNYALISILAIIVIAAIYFTITSLYGNGVSRSNTDFLQNADTAVVSDEKPSSLFSYFDKADSLVLTAKAKDSAWIRLLIDGKQIIEILMRPGNEESWAASKYFILDQGNAGAIQFYRNNQLLPSFGKPGTVVKNIKITMSEIINPMEFKDTTLTRKAVRKKAPDTIEKKPRLIEESKINTDKNIFNREEGNESPQ